MRRAQERTGTNPNNSAAVARELPHVLAPAFANRLTLPTSRASRKKEHIKSTQYSWPEIFWPDMTNKKISPAIQDFEHFSFICTGIIKDGNARHACGRQGTKQVHTVLLDQSNVP